MGEHQNLGIFLQLGNPRPRYLPLEIQSYKFLIVTNENQNQEQRNINKCMYTFMLHFTFSSCNLT
jgi:hypothetical protein